jgi:hypothetical protein
MANKNYVPEEVLRAHAYALEIIAAYLVVSGTVSPDKMSGLIRMTAAKAESDGFKKSAEYLREIFANGLNGEWEKGWREAQQKN